MSGGIGNIPDDPVDAVPFVTVDVLGMIDNSPLEPDTDVTDLESRAEELRILLEQQSPKRPLVIEFSGSPKAGKTRSITVLELFLKRNGFKVEVYTERASVSPIKSKGHLNFNVWVSCASLQGMLEALYKDIDVFILDRGIFDALVWNEWLRRTGKITKEEATQVEQFFTMDRWVDLVDVLFVMRCDPSISIQREYADQLTNRRGTIMAEDTLRQFIECIDKTILEHRARFRKTVTIDTTHTRTREGVKKIAAETLNTLNGFLDESIAVISAHSLNLPEAGFVRDQNSTANFVNAVNEQKRFMARSLAEHNPGFIQPIPCAMLRFGNKVLILKRKKRSHPLHDTYAVWAGGHVSESDDDPNILIKTLERELAEEVFIKDTFELNKTPLGLLRTNEDARASRHVGVLFEITLRNEEVALALDQKEFRETRGSSMSGKLVEIDRLHEIYNQMGEWSKSIVDQFWPDQTARPPSPLFNE